MAKRPKAVVFDMDDVLCHYHFGRRLACLSGMTGVASEVINKVIWEQGFDEDADRGLYTAEEYLRGFCERIGATLSEQQWLEARAISMEPDEQVLNMARQVKQRAIVALLSNNGPLLKESIDAVFPELVEIFGERAYFSYEFAAAKPDPAVHRRHRDLHKGCDSGRAAHPSFPFGVRITSGAGCLRAAGVTGEIGLPSYLSGLELSGFIRQDAKIGIFTLQVL
jgi:putative hydrolase of the HAD superfamily